jgi:hypothetical protein
MNHQLMSVDHESIMTLMLGPLLGTEYELINAINAATMNHEIHKNMESSSMALANLHL